MESSVKAGLIVALIAMTAVAVALATFMVQTYRHEEATRTEATRLAQVMADLDKSKAALAEQVKTLTASNAALTQQLNELRSSDRRAYADAARLETEGDLPGAVAAFDAFLKAYPDSALHADAEASVTRLRKEVVARQAAEDAALKNAVASAEKAPDPLQAIKIMETFAHEHPQLAEQAKAVQAHYTEAAERLQEQRRTEAAVGIAIDQVETGWVRSNIGFEALWVPEVRFQVRNVSPQPLKFLQFVVQFVKSGTKVTFGPDAAAHPIDSVGNPPLQPGYSKVVVLRGGAGFQTDAAFSSDAPPKLTAELFVGREFKERLPLRSIEVEPKPRHPAGAEASW
jgi:hypothetical protein